MIERAERTLVIESPYLLGNRIEPAICAAAQRGVKVTIITPYRSNKLLYRLWSRKLHQRLNHPNITINGHTDNGGMTHAKLVIVDDRWATFGSFNMIELEGLTQKELNVFTSDSGLIAELNAFVADDLAHTVPIPSPRFASVRLTYRALYHLHKWWTRRLLQNPEWKAIYC
jgi:cardiolipin synthase